MKRRFKAASRIAMGIGLLALTACNGISIVGGGTGGTGGTGAGGGNPSKKVDKIDIVLAIDNSRSMADKQQILSLALSDLIESLTNPPCVDANGIQAAMQPPSGLEVCPNGTQRIHAPIRDIHVGIVSSSLGGHGADSCPTTETITCNGSPNISNNDAGHVLSRGDACGTTSVPTYQDLGFLAWDLTQTQVPPGENDTTVFTTKIKTMVLGTGQVGCGYESQLESWYRFLVDPEPYQSITIQNGMATPQGIDTALIQQRVEFLRPYSLLAILMLSDEDDCSIKEFGQFYFAAQTRDPNSPSQQFLLPRARAICATDPNDPCCASCGQAVPAGCLADPTCQTNPTLSPLEDNVNLRCWDQKRRFGIDFLYPVDRYVQGLSSATVPTRTGDLVNNPIYSDLNPNDDITDIRDPGLVVLAGIVGVPWQDVARDPNDLTKGYKNATELSQTGTWDVILGNPTNYVSPTDPFMIQSVDMRSGTNPITGDAIAQPNGTTPINGHEYSISNRDDLQYSCIFPLATPVDCSAPGTTACDCTDPSNDNPLCAPNPADGGNRTPQVNAKAYPGTRHLAVLKGLGPQGVVASICPSQFNDQTKADYAYRPAIRSLVERVRTRLKQAD